MADTSADQPTQADLVQAAPSSPSGEMVVPPIAVGPANPPLTAPWQLKIMPPKKRALMVPHVDEDGTAEEYYPGDVVPTIFIDPTTKKYVVNDLKRFIKPFTVSMEGGSVTLPANGESDLIPIQVDSKGPFEISRAFFTSEQPEGFTIEIMDADNRALLTNREVHVSTIASGQGVTLPLSGNFPSSTSGGRPFLWPTTYFIDPSEGGMIVVKLRNLSGSQNTVRFSLHGRRWLYLQAPDKIAGRMAKIYRSKPRVQPFFYTTDQYVNLLGGASGSFVSRLGDDGWHEISKLMAVFTGAFSVRISEKTTGKRYMENLLPSPLVFGTAEFPFITWEDSLFEPNMRLVYELLDTSGSPNTIWLTMAGRKLLFDPMDDQFRRPGHASGRA
jgi:hypothetical protein